MPTLHKFKLFPTQCAVAVAASPSRSPVVHLRRRKTLRMFLSRRRLHRSSDSPLSDEDHDRGEDDDDRPPEKAREAHRVRRKLKDLFVSSPPPVERGGREGGDGEERGLLSDGGGVGGLTRTRRGVGGGVLSRPLTASFRCRLLRRAWRPVLVPIPE